MTMEVQYSDRFDYLGRSVGRRLIDNVRDRRQKALDAFSGFRVQFTLDGKTLRELEFAARPSESDLIRKAGPDAKIVSIRPCRRSDRKPVARPVMLTV